jgi:hypothetical protein
MQARTGLMYVPGFFVVEKDAGEFDGGRAPAPFLYISYDIAYTPNIVQV